MIAGMERFGTTGGASKARTLCGARGYCLFAMVVGMERVGATGGASSSPTKSERYSANTKPYKHTQTLALRKARVIVRCWKVMRGEGVCDNNIKRSQLVAVTAYLIYWFV